MVQYVLCSDLTCGVLEALMTLHVRVYPDSLVFLLSLHHVRVRHVMLVVAPDEVVDWCLVQHRHHPHPLQSISVIDSLTVNLYLV